MVTQKELKAKLATAIKERDAMKKGAIVIAPEMKEPQVLYHKTENEKYFQNMFKYITKHNR